MRGLVTKDGLHTCSVGMRGGSASYTCLIFTRVRSEVLIGHSHACAAAVCETVDFVQ